MYIHPFKYIHTSLQQLGTDFVCPVAAPGSLSLSWESLGGSWMGCLFPRVPNLGSQRLLCHCATLGLSRWASDGHHWPAHSSYSSSVLAAASRAKAGEGVCTISSGMGMVCSWYSGPGLQTFSNLGFYFGFRECTGFVVDVPVCLNETLLHELFQVLRFTEIRHSLGACGWHETWGTTFWHPGSHSSDTSGYLNYKLEMDMNKL